MNYTLLFFCPPFFICKMQSISELRGKTDTHKYHNHQKCQILWPKINLPWLCFIFRPQNDWSRNSKLWMIRKTNMFAGDHSQSPDTLITCHLSIKLALWMPVNQCSSLLMYNLYMYDTDLYIWVCSSVVDCLCTCNEVFT